MKMMMIVVVVVESSCALIALHFAKFDTAAAAAEHLEQDFERERHW